MEVLNYERKEGYLQLIKSREGLLMGEAVVSNWREIYHIYAINTTEEDMEVAIDLQELISFDYCQLPGDELEEYSADENYLPPEYRIQAILNILEFNHLNLEEKASIGC